MSYQDHLKTCSYCSKNSPQKVTVRVKSASSYNKQKKLSQLGAIIKGTPYAGLDTSLRPKATGASSSSSSSSFANYSKVNGPLEKKFKLKELGKMIRGL